MNIRSGGNTLFDTSSVFTLKATGVLLHSNGNLNLESANATVDSSGSAEMKAGGPVRIRGSIVTTN